MSEGGVMGAVGTLPSGVALFGVVVGRQPLAAPAVRDMSAASARAAPATKG